ncbi:hypothetical protein, partial [Sphingomonas faeni]|uniref:hypothetical protein n=1 Tax=Sphingomonas faeni TaxID=185950 RepID=UPI0020C7A9DA
TPCVRESQAQILDWHRNLERDVANTVSIHIAAGSPCYITVVGTVTKSAARRRPLVRFAITEQARSRNLDTAQSGWERSDG